MNLRSLLCLLIIISFLASSIILLPDSYAQSTLNIPEPGTMVLLSSAYTPVLIKGLKINPNNPLNLDFIVSTGNDDGAISNRPYLKDESQKLIKYFFAALTLPEQDVWVNLSPYEKDRIVPKLTGETEMGRDMLAQDYLLKQITASLIYPEKGLGKEFWHKIYAEAYQRYGTTQVPVNTFNKVWIVADKASVYEAKDTVFVVDAHLKVMLEEDYLATQKHQVPSHGFSSNIVREIVLPALEKEVNEGKNFANLRQIFHSIILAKWYKESLKSALLNQVYSNKNKVVGLSYKNLSSQNPGYIYQQYLKAYKKGVFNYIKEDINQTTQQPIPRKYFSGGVSAQMKIDHAQISDLRRSLQGLLEAGSFLFFVSEKSLSQGRDKAMFNVVENGMEFKLTRLKKETPLGGFPLYKSDVFLKKEKNDGKVTSSGPFNEVDRKYIQAIISAYYSIYHKDKDFTGNLKMGLPGAIVNHMAHQDLKDVIKDNTRIISIAEGEGPMSFKQQSEQSIKRLFDSFPDLPVFKISLGEKIYYLIYTEEYPIIITPNSPLTGKEILRNKIDVWENKEHFNLNISDDPPTRNDGYKGISLAEDINFNPGILGRQDLLNRMHMRLYQENDGNYYIALIILPSSNSLHPKIEAEAFLKTSDNQLAKSIFEHFKYGDDLDFIKLKDDFRKLNEQLIMTKRDRNVLLSHFLLKVFNDAVERQEITWDQVQEAKKRELTPQRVQQIEDKITRLRARPNVKFESRTLPFLDKQEFEISETPTKFYFKTHDGYLEFPLQLGQNILKYLLSHVKRLKNAFDREPNNVSNNSAHHLFIQWLTKEVHEAIERGDISDEAMMNDITRDSDIWQIGLDVPSIWKLRSLVFRKKKMEGGYITPVDFREDEEIYINLIRTHFFITYKNNERAFPNLEYSRYPEEKLKLELEQRFTTKDCEKIWPILHSAYEVAKVKVTVGEILDSNITADQLLVQNDFGEPGFKRLSEIIIKSGLLPVGTMPSWAINKESSIKILMPEFYLPAKNFCLAKGIQKIADLYKYTISNINEFPYMKRVGTLSIIRALESHGFSPLEQQRVSLVRHQDWQEGGIDLDTSKIGLQRQGPGLEINYDSDMIKRFKRGNFDGIMPIITKIAPVSNIYQLFGLKDS